MQINHGYLDFHVHVGERIGGYALRDGFAELAKLCQSAADASTPALAGMGVFVTQQPGLTMQESLLRMQEAAAQDFPYPICWHLTPTTSTVEEVIPLLGKGIDLKFYTTYRQAGLYLSYSRLEAWMQDLSSHKTRILVHCEDDACLSRYADRYPFRYPIDHCKRRPELAETMAVDRILDLAVKHQHPVHIVHVSAPEAALLIQDAKSSFRGITCESSPHYLLHTEDDLLAPNGHRWLCTPPLRSERSRGRLVELMQDAVFDILASDHCAFTASDKDRYKDAPQLVPQGIAGIASLYSSIEKAFVETKRLSQAQLEAMTRSRVLELMNL